MKEKEATEANYKSPQVRVDRIRNQREWEKSHEETFGLEFSERSSMTRKQIYKGYSILIDSSPETIRERGLSGTVSTEITEDIDFSFVSGYLVEGYMEKYAIFIDEMYLKLKKLDSEEARDTVTRFLAVMYAMGVTIHPYADANGQTYRMLSLSYLHELLPETKNLFFPYRSGKSDLFAFDPDIYIPDVSIGNEKIGEIITERVCKQAEFFVSDAGKTILADYILGINSEETGKLISEYTSLSVVGILRSLNKLGTDMQSCLKNWISLNYSYYYALRKNNQKI